MAIPEGSNVTGTDSTILTALRGRFSRRSTQPSHKFFVAGCARNGRFGLCMTCMEKNRT
jgi:hypothetical protein